MQFDVKHNDSGSSARAGELVTDHGTIETPIFMPVGTAGTVKAVHQRELEEDINAPIIFASPLVIDGSPLVIDGRPLVIDRSPLVIDGRPLVIDGSPLIINGRPSVINGEANIVD